MPKEHRIVKQIKARVASKTNELETVDGMIDAAERALAELQVRRTALVLGIDEDEAMLEQAKPKQPRANKVKTLGQQMGTEAKEGQA